MCTTRWARPEWLTIHIPCRTIERVYGRGNFDDAGDALNDIVDAVRNEHGVPYRARIDFECAHANPWFHAMTLQMEGVSQALCEAILGQVIALGLDDASHEPPGPVLREGEDS